MNNNNNNSPLEPVVITKKFNFDENKKDGNDYEVIKDVYSYQTKSKLDGLPLWVKILVSCILIIFAIDAIVGGAFAIEAVNNISSSQNQTQNFILEIILFN